MHGRRHRRGQRLPRRRAAGGAPRRAGVGRRKTWPFQNAQRRRRSGDVHDLVGRRARRGTRRRRSRDVGAFASRSPSLERRHGSELRGRVAGCGSDAVGDRRDRRATNAGVVVRDVGERGAFAVEKRRCRSSPSRNARMSRMRSRNGDVRADAENRERAQRRDEPRDRERRGFRRWRSPSRASDRSGPTPRRLRRRRSRRGRRAAAARGRAAARPACGRKPCAGSSA